MAKLNVIDIEVQRAKRFATRFQSEVAVRKQERALEENTFRLASGKCQTDSERCNQVSNSFTNYIDTKQVKYLMNFR